MNPFEIYIPLIYTYVCDVYMFMYEFMYEQG